jgi:hypothetical protein
MPFGSIFRERILLEAVSSGYREKYRCTEHPIPPMHILAESKAGGGRCYNFVTTSSITGAILHKGRLCKQQELRNDSRGPGT